MTVFWSKLVSHPVCNSLSFNTLAMTYGRSCVSDDCFDLSANANRKIYQEKSDTGNFKPSTEMLVHAFITCRLDQWSPVCPP